LRKRRERHGASTYSGFVKARAAAAVAVLVTGVVVVGGAARHDLAAAAGAGPALTVDLTAGRHRISPDIYGMNFAPTKLAKSVRLTSDRWGGNATSRYNYRNHTRNTANDYYFENIVEPKSGWLETFVRHDLAHRTQPVVTVPMIGWVAKRSPSAHPFACGFRTGKYGAQQSTDPYDPRCGNGVKVNGELITGNAPHDTSVAAGPTFVRQMVAHLVRVFGHASHGGVPTYALDNEPSLWSSTHRDVHPRQLTYDELWSKSRRTALAIKAADPRAKVEGPGDWGWCAYFFSAADPSGCSIGTDRKAHGNLPAAAWYLKRFGAYRHKHHKRLLDYFDEHFYPQEIGVALSPAGDAHTQALRLRSTRTLWDPHYRDESWTSDLGLGPVRLIPRMRHWRDRYAPGTKLAIGEYNWGALDSINGALAEADVLGIFGRERLDRALLWSPPAASEPGAFAFRLYRNYDGRGHRFGDVGVRAHSAKQGQLSIYAAQRTSDHAATVIVINKTGHALTSRLTLAHSTATAAQVWTYDGSHPGKIRHRRSVALSGSVLRHTYPASSITLFVLPSRR
jgi:glycosyl hydrolase family 44